MASQINAANLEITGSNSIYNYSYSISPDALIFKQGENELLRADKDGITLTGEIKASKGTIGGFTIGSTAIYSGITSLNDSTNSGVYLGTNGIWLGTSTAFSVDKSGSLKSNKGTIGGWTISSSGLSKTETVSDVSTTIRLQTSYGSGSGTGDISTINPVFEVIYSGTSKFYVRRNGYLHAEDADISGKIQASSGRIGTWYIGSGELYSGDAGISTHANYTKPSLVTSGSNSKVIFYSGNSDRINGNFTVLADGSLYAKAADISGKIQASSGKIAGLEMGTESRTIGSTTVTGSVLKTTEADPNFSIFSYNYNGNIGSVLKVKTLELENQNFDNLTATKLEVGTATYRSNGLYYNDSLIMSYNFTISHSSSSITATLSYNWASCNITLTLSKALSKVKTFGLRLHCTWGDWSYHSMTLQAGETSKTQTFSGPFWGWDNAIFTASGTSSYTFSESDESYIEFYKNIEPGWSTYDCGSSSYRWNCVYTKNLDNSSDIKLKKDIHLLDDKYSKVFDELRPVTYIFKDDENEETHIGFVAQDVERAFLKVGITSGEIAVHHIGIDADNNQIQSLRYLEFIALNTYEIQKLKKRVDELESVLKVNDAS